MNNMKTLNNAGKSVAAIIIILVASVAIPQLFGQSKKTLEGAFYWKNGKAYFFKGNQYVRYDIQTGLIPVIRNPLIMKPGPDCHGRMGSMLPSIGETAKPVFSGTVNIFVMI